MLRLLVFLLALLVSAAAAVLVGAVAGPWFDQVASSWSAGLRFWLLIAALLLGCLLIPLYVATKLYFRRKDRGGQVSWANSFLLMSLVLGAVLAGGALYAAPVSPQELIRERATYLPRLIAQRLSGLTSGMPDAETVAQLLAEPGEDGREQLAQVLEAVLEKEQFTVELELEAQFVQEGQRVQASFGEGLVAVDLRGGAEANQRLELHLNDARQPEPQRLDAVLVIKGMKVYLWVQEQSKKAVTLKIDLGPYLEAGGSGVADQFGFSTQSVQKTRDDLDQLKKDPRQALSQSGDDYGAAKLVAPGVLKLQSEGAKDAVLLYYDRSSNLPRMLVARGNKQQAVMALHLRDWQRGVQVDGSLPQPEESYVTLEQMLGLKFGLQLKQLGEVMQRWGENITKANQQP